VYNNLSFLVLHTILAGVLQPGHAAHGADQAAGVLSHTAEEAGYRHARHQVSLGSVLSAFSGTAHREALLDKGDNGVVME
jgi:hypothetical protein